MENVEKEGNQAVPSMAFLSELWLNLIQVQSREISKEGKKTPTKTKSFLWQKNSCSCNLMKHQVYYQNRSRMQICK